MSKLHCFSLLQLGPLTLQSIAVCPSCPRLSQYFSLAFSDSLPFLHGFALTCMFNAPATVPPELHCSCVQSHGFEPRRCFLACSCCYLCRSLLSLRQYHFQASGINGSPPQVRKVQRPSAAPSSPVLHVRTPCGAWLPSSALLEARCRVRRSCIVLQGLLSCLGPGACVSSI